MVRVMEENLVYTVGNVIIIYLHKHNIILHRIVAKNSIIKSII